MTEDIYQHYRDEERSFVDQVYHWIDDVDRQYVPYVSVFLTPREQMIAEHLIRGHAEGTIKFQFWGGYNGAERQRVIIYPQYDVIEKTDFQLALLNIQYPEKFGELTHGKILGTLISSGIGRERIGDIITDGTQWHCIVDQSIAPYLMQEIQKISNFRVHLELLSFDDILTSSEQWETIQVFASSLRLDTLISNVYNFSRQRAKNAVSSGLVKVNFMIMDRPDIVIGVRDIVSVRQLGRFWITSIDGLSKKDNYRLTINRLIK